MTGIKIIKTNGVYWFNPVKDVSVPFDEVDDIDFGFCYLRIRGQATALVSDFDAYSQLITLRDKEMEK